MSPSDTDDRQLNPLAAIHSGARIGRGSVVHPFVAVGDGVTIGDEVELFPSAVIGREPKGANAISRPPVFRRELSIGNGCSIGAGAVIYYDVVMGDGCLVGDGASIREGARIGNNCIISRLVTLNYNVTLGYGVKVMDGTHLTGDMFLGDGVFVGPGVMTANDDTPLQAAEGIERLSGPIVEDHAVIGASAILLPGVRIGAGAVVAAGATVTRDVPAGSRVFGSPARPR